MGTSPMREFVPLETKGDPRGNISFLLHIESELIQKTKQVPFRGAKLVSKEPALFAQRQDGTLQQVLRMRPEGFSQTQLTKLLENVVFGLAYLQKKKCAFLDIHPRSILYFGAKGFKLASPLTLGGKGLSDQPPLYYSPPEHLEYRRKEATPAEYSKGDLFSLGLVILEAALGRSVMDVYKEGALNPKALEAKFAQLQQRYSEPFCKLVGLLLEPHPQNRMDAFEMSLLLNNQLNIKPLFSRLSQQEPMRVSTSPMASSLHSSGIKVSPSNFVMTSSPSKEGLGQEGINLIKQQIEISKREVSKLRGI